MHHKWCFTLLGVFLFGTVLFVATSSIHVMAASTSTHICYHSNLPPPNFDPGWFHNQQSPTQVQPPVQVSPPQDSFGPVIDHCPSSETTIGEQDQIAGEDDARSTCTRTDLSGHTQAYINGWWDSYDRFCPPPTIR